MRTLRLLLLFFLCLLSKSQNIGGNINSYAQVNGIAGNVLTVGTTVGFGVGDKVMIIQMKGATVNGGNTMNFGNITALNSAGLYEFKTITAINGNQITLNSALVNTYNTNDYVQIVKVARYCVATVTSNITCPPWNGTTGGIIALECGTLILNADIIADGCGFRGGNFITGFFGCNTGVWAAGGASGGEKGESISDWIPNFNQNKANQANGGGGSNRGNSGGGGGGNGGAGGLGGNQYNGCGNAVDERGRGGLALTPVANRLFFGGGGGGGFRDNGQPCSNGGNGGGIIYIESQHIQANNRIISSNGANANPISINDEGAGGGGAGGTIFLLCNNITGNLTVRTIGGNGGSNFNTIFQTMCHGPGGGGGGGIFGHCFAAIPGNITYQSNGGNAGTINNPLSQCFANNQTFGAQNGQNGTSLSNLPPPPPIVYPNISVVSSPASICANNFNNSTYISTLTVSGAQTYSWIAFNNIGLSGSSSATQAVITVSSTTSLNATGSATVIGFDITGLCPDTATVSVSILKNPTISVSSTSICSGQQATLTASGANSYTWAPSSSLNTQTGSVVIASPNQSTQYSVVGFDGNCYSSTTTLNVTVFPIPQIQISAPSSTICAGNYLNLSASGASNYTWTPNQYINNNQQANVIVNPPTTTEYTITGESNNCIGTTVFQVSVIPSPTLQLSFSSDTICKGNISVISVNGAQYYEWAPNISISSTVGSNVTFNPEVTTIYTVTGYNGLCSTSSIVTIFVVPYPNAEPSSASNVICKGMSVQLSATGAMFYHWQPSVSLSNPNVPNPVAFPTENTTYTVVSGNYLGNFSCVVTKYIHIDVIPKAEILGQDNYSVCIGETKILNVGGSYSYSWSPSIFLSNPNSSSPMCSPTVSIVYTVTGNNMNICSAQKQITVTVINLPKVDAGRDTTFNLDEPMYLNGSGQGTLTWVYDPDILCLVCPTTQIYAENSKCYVLVAENDYGCKNKDEVCIEISKDFGLFLPNSFTPNGDGLNDEFFVKGHGILEFNMSIFDRWGEEVFKAHNFDTRWNGTCKGEPCQQGVYTYLIKFKPLDGNIRTKTGHVTLLR